MHELKSTSMLYIDLVCNCMLKSVHDGLIDPQLLIITDEAYFDSRGYVKY
jgi:hypothetical protein